MVRAAGGDESWVIPGSSESVSSARVSVLSGDGITLWGCAAPEQDTSAHAELHLAPEDTVIIGRAEGNGVPYLDPAYRATTIVPHTGRSILKSEGRGQDCTVSRAHFMLRGTGSGIVLINGVPRRGGGIRPPRNWTQLLVPNDRRLGSGEEYVIRRGESVTLLLPNGSQVRIEAR